MTRRHKDLLYVGLALILAGVAVQRFRAFGSRSQRSLWSGERGSLSESGRQVSRASRILKEKDGKTLLWASGNPRSDDAEWFDVTGAPMDPAEFQYAIGKDTIRAIDKPQFLDANDPRLAERGITDATRVIGYQRKDDAKAYPIHILNRHELINDVVGSKPVTVGW